MIKNKNNLEVESDNSKNANISKELEQALSISEEQARYIIDHDIEYENCHKYSAICFNRKIGGSTRCKDCETGKHSYKWKLII